MTQLTAVKNEAPVKNTTADVKKVEKEIIITEAIEDNKEKERTLLDVARDMDTAKKKLSKCNIQIDAFDVKIVELNGKKAEIDREAEEHRSVLQSLKKELNSLSSSVMGVNF